MKKSDLKAGYLVEVRKCSEGTVGILMPQTSCDELNICRPARMGISNLSDYREDLKNKFDTDYDIIRVWGYANIINALSLGTHTRKLLWEREKPKTKVTLELTDEQLEKIRGIINE